MRPDHKLNLLRALAAPIVAKKAFYPAQEVLLRHGVHVRICTVICVNIPG